jgi:hypothetical protein
LPVRPHLTWAAIAVAALSLSFTASAASPTAIYSDYVADGKLGCNYSRTDLRAALDSTALNQYGDPYAIEGFQRAVRRELAPGGCASSAGSGGFWWTWLVIGIPAVIVFVVGGFAAKRAP